MTALKDITNKTFGRLTVLSRAENTPSGKSRWVCRCDCGNVTTPQSTNLISGHTQSCGCLGRERRLASLTKHGLGWHPLYSTWYNMIDRCLNPENPRFPSYGGRGIEVCESWLTLKNFVEGMGDRPTKKHTLDRIDNDENYEPENCKWSTPVEQQRNRRDSSFLEYGGEVKHIRQWAEEIGVEYYTLYSRISRGWSVERALTTPAGGRSSCQ